MIFFSIFFAFDVILPFFEGLFNFLNYTRSMFLNTFFARFAIRLIKLSGDLNDESQSNDIYIFMVYIYSVYTSFGATSTRW